MRALPINTLAFWAGDKIILALKYILRNLVLYFVFINLNQLGVTEDTAGKHHLGIRLHIKFFLNLSDLLFDSLGLNQHRLNPPLPGQAMVTR
jgi:hypothetical protein